MTNSSAMSAKKSVCYLQELPLTRSTTEQRLDALRHRSVPKITGRKHRIPRKFVITDLLDSSQHNRDDEGDDNSSANEVYSEDLSASSSSVRKGKTQVRGRFTITDLTPESPEALAEREDLSVSMGATPLRAMNISRRQSSRKLSTRRPFQSAGDVRSSVGLKKGLLSQKQYPPQQESPAFASFQPLATDSARVELPAQHAVFDHHLEYLERETYEMRSVLESMVATNAQWIETLASAGLLQAKSLPRSSGEPSIEQMAPDETLLQSRYRAIEKAYTELQANYETVCVKTERLEVKNAMLEIRLQQQIDRSTMLRSQLDKLTQYTENLIVESSEPTLHDYSSDLNSILDEHSESHSPSADEMTNGNGYGFTYNVVKSQQNRWDGVEEECISDTSTEGCSTRKTMSPPTSDEDNSRYCREIELNATEPTSSNNCGRNCDLDLMLDAQCSQLRQSLRLEDRADDVSLIESLDSMAVCPSVTKLDSNGDDEYDGNSHIGRSDRQHLCQKSRFLKHSNSLASLNYSTVSSTSSLAGYGLHLATMAQSKPGFFANAATSTLYGPHPESYPNVSTQQNAPQDDNTYNVLSSENLHFHDYQSLLQVAAERSVENVATQREFPFTISKKTTSLPGANEVYEKTRATGSLLQRLTVRRW